MAEKSVKIITVKRFLEKMTKRNIEVCVPVIIPVTFLHTQQSDLFDGISFFIDASLYVIIDGLRKYPQELGKVIVVNGGEVHPKFNPEETTYILSKGLPEFRIPNFHVSQLISPDWISHCVERQRILETKEFLLIDLQQIFGDNNDNDNTSSESEEEERIESAEKQSSSKTGKVNILSFYPLMIVKIFNICEHGYPKCTGPLRQ